MWIQEFSYQTMYFDLDAVDSPFLARVLSVGCIEDSTTETSMDEMCEKAQLGITMTSNVGDEIDCSSDGVDLSNSSYEEPVPEEEIDVSMEFSLGPHPNPPVNILVNPNDPTLLWLAHMLRRQETRPEVMDKFSCASTIQCDGCSQGATTSPEKIWTLYDTYANDLGIHIRYMCPRSGHDQFLVSENDACNHCVRRSMPRRGTKDERHRLVTCDATSQLVRISQANIDEIIELHSHHHAGNHNNFKNRDFETRFSDRFRAGLETQQEYLNHILTIQIVPSCDAFRLGDASTGSPWAAYCLMWDLNPNKRFLPSSLVNLGILASGNLAKPDDIRLDMMMIRLNAECFRWANNLFLVHDRNGIVWNLRFRVTGSLLDSEAAYKLFLHPHWMTVGTRFEPFGGCQYCLEVPVRLNGTSRLPVVQTAQRRNGRDTVDASRLRRSGFRGCSSLMRITPSSEGFLDLLHVLELGYFKDTETDLRAGTRFSLLKLYNQADLNICNDVRLPTYYGHGFRPLGFPKRGRELLVSAMTQVLLCLMLRCNHSPLYTPIESENAAALAAFFCCDLLNLRRLFDTEVPEGVVLEVADTIEELSTVYEDLFGLERVTYKQHVLRVHLPQMLRSTGNIVDHDTGVFEHAHMRLKELLSTKVKYGWESSMIIRSYIYPRVLQDLEERKRGTPWETQADKLLGSISRKVGGETQVRISDEVSIPRGGVIVDIPVPPQLLALVRHGCISVYRRVIYKGIPYSTHHEQFGHPKPKFSMQNRIVFHDGGGGVHFGKILGIGSTVRNDFFLLVGVYTVSTEVTSTLRNIITGIPRFHALANVYDRTVVDNHFVVTCNRNIVKHHVIIPLDSVDGFHIKVTIPPDTYLIYLPSRKRSS